MSFVFIRVNAEVCMHVSHLNMDMMSIVTTCSYRMATAFKTFQQCAKFACKDTSVSSGFSKLPFSSL